MNTGRFHSDVLQILPLRLVPGQDLRLALQEILHQRGVGAAYVLQGIGSLSAATLRYAGANALTTCGGEFEILTLAGTLSSDGAHLHMSISDRDGQVIGGHVGTGCIVRTTAEICVAVLPQFHFAREADSQTGFAELVIRARP